MSSVIFVHSMAELVVFHIEDVQQKGSPGLAGETSLGLSPAFFAIKLMLLSLQGNVIMECMSP